MTTRGRNEDSAHRAIEPLCSDGSARSCTAGVPCSLLRLSFPTVIHGSGDSSQLAPLGLVQHGPLGDAERGGGFGARREGLRDAPQQSRVPCCPTNVLQAALLLPSCRECC